MYHVRLDYGNKTQLAHLDLFGDDWLTTEQVDEGVGDVLPQQAHCQVGRVGAHQHKHADHGREGRARYHGRRDHQLNRHKGSGCSAERNTVLLLCDILLEV